MNEGLGTDDRFEVSERDELIHRVRLRDVAGAEHDDRHVPRRDFAGVAREENNVRLALPAHGTRGLPE